MKSIPIFIILITAIFNLSDSNDTQEDGWKLRKSKNGIEVYTRKVKNSNLIEFRATTTLHASLLKARKIIDDVESYPVWMANLGKSRTIKKISNTERYDYFEIKVPWPFENRDMVLQVKSLFPKNNIIHIELMNSPDYIPVKQNRVRIREAKGSWHFLSIEKNKTKVTYQLYNNPGGNIPTWVIDLLIVEGPYQTLMNFHEQVEKSK
jgi:ribosome-associated toxin RatA of RatAB toxin-antitoxin module